MAKLFKTDGTTQHVEPKNGKTFTLEELQDYVGGDIEMVHAFNRENFTISGEFFIMNEEGKLRGLEVNLKATDQYRKKVHPFDVLVGDVLLCESDEIE